MRVRVQVDEYREFGLVTRGEHAGGELVFARAPLLCSVSIIYKTRPNTKTEGLNSLGGTKVNRIAKMNKREYS